MTVATTLPSWQKCSKVLQCKLCKTKEHILCGAKAKDFTVFIYFHKLRYLPVLQSSTKQPTRPNRSILTLGPEASPAIHPLCDCCNWDWSPHSIPSLPSQKECLSFQNCLESKLSKQKFSKRDMMRIVHTKKDSFFITVIRAPNKGLFPLIRPGVIMGQCLIGRAVRWL